MQCTANNGSICRSTGLIIVVTEINTAMYGAGAGLLLKIVWIRCLATNSVKLTVSNYFLVDQDPKTNLAMPDKSRHRYVT